MGNRNRYRAGDPRLHRLLQGSGAGRPGSRRASGKSAEDRLAFYLEAGKITGWVREYRWHPERKWRFDFAWPELLVGVEIDGQVHSIREKMDRDIERSREAALAGWLVLRFRPAEIDSVSDRDIRRALSKRGRDIARGASL